MGRQAQYVIVETETLMELVEGDLARALRMISQVDEWLEQLRQFVLFRALQRWLRKLHAIVGGASRVLEQLTSGGTAATA